MAARVHLIAPAGTCKDFIQAIGAHTPESLVAMVQQAVGSAISVTADMTLLAAEEEELRGGRTDDERRAADIETALAADDVQALAPGVTIALANPLHSLSSHDWLLGE